MKAQTVPQYDAPHQFEPLLPSEAAAAPLLERASDLARAANALGAVAGQGALLELRTLLRSMNSYYTNRIEGEHTRPSDIELALRQDFSSDADLARRQRLAVAHIHTEERCEAALSQRLAADGELMAYEHSGFWQPMDTLRDKTHLEELWAEGNAPWKTWK